VELAKTIGTVRPDKGRWMIDICVDGDRYKLRHLPVVGGGWLPYRDEETAAEVLTMIRAAISTGSTVTMALAPYLRGGGNKFKVRACYLRFIVQKQKNADAGEIRQQRVRDLQGHLDRGWLLELENISIHEVNYDRLEELKNSLYERGLAARSVKHCLTDFRTFLRWLSKRQELAGVPPFPTVVVPDYRPNIPTGAQQDAMLAAIPEKRRGFFLVRGYMGLRDEEATRSLVQDYRLGETPADDELFVRGKGGRNRFLPVETEVADWVRAHRPVGGLGEAGVPLFPNPRTGRAWAAQTRRAVMHAAMDAAGFKTKPNEALRHCFGTRTANKLLREGKGESDAIRMVMQIMGHTTTESSRRYVKLATSTLKSAMVRG
jgi:site-specific recombinase XerD